jgi:threonine/homoserine/homoserine lactone efflux protein
MSWELWGLFVVTEGLLCITPGPAVLLVVAQGLTRGIPAGASATAGILIGNTIYFVLSATSLGVLIVASYEVFFLIKWLGAAYLVWLGISAFRGRSSTLSVSPAKRAGLFRVFGNGIALQLANPKALLFFIALLPQFIDSKGDIVSQMFILGMTSVLLEFLALLAYSAFASRFSVIAMQPRFVRTADRIAGSFLIGAGVLTAAIRR